MKKILNILSIFSLMLFTGTTILACSTYAYTPDQLGKIFKIIKRIQDNIIDNNIRLKDKQDIINNIVNNIKDIDDVYFEKNSNIKENDVLINININKINDKSFETTIEFFESYKINGGYEYKSDYSQSSEYSFLRKLEEIEDIEIESNDIKNDRESGYARIYIKNYSKIETISFKPIENEEQFEKWWITNDEFDNVYIAVEFKKIINYKNNVTKFELSATNVNNKKVISITNIFDSERNIQTNIDKVNLIWGDKFEIKVLNYSLVSDLKIKCDFDLKEIKYDNKSGIISGYAIKNKDNNFLREEQFSVYLISDLYNTKVLSFSIKPIEIFENLNDENINLSTTSKTYLKVNQNIDELTFSALSHKSFDYENVVFENGNYTNDNLQVKYRKTDEVILSAWWANEKKESYVLVDSSYSKVIDGETYTQKFKNYRLHFSVTQWDKKLDIFSFKNDVKFESRAKNKYLKYNFDDLSKEIKVFTNSNSINFYLKNTFYRKINNLNDLYIEDTNLVSLNPTFKDFPAKNIEYIKINVISIQNIEEFNKAEKTNLIYNIGKSNLNSFKIQIIYKES
ncbi:hypothetical protein [Spiroplasma tabanidicola]|uniref:Lipoprotein n=1 Tax=Spiroplasma tabanidicola TaxID=324079 RepID=A0A6I6C7S0_9MOLU|nr:hypothetical protein [Spiroplasma tabanidicola]QGS51826.1 hypothetical protein STABA_v1c04630 [Spiroplasma tabanidicola]